MSPILNTRSFVTRSLVLALVLVVGFVTAIPVSVAHAHDDGFPFEAKFPQDVEKTSFSNTWGARRSSGRRHKGTDLMAEKLTEVYAIADGVVTRIAETSRPGRYLIIEHAGGWDSYYIHLNDDNPGTDDGRAPWSLTVAPGLEVGSEVSAGELIGFVGDSGNAEGSGAHTHFELLQNGVNINPYHVLLEAFERDLAENERIKFYADQAGGNFLIF